MDRTVPDRAATRPIRTRRTVTAGLACAAIAVLITPTTAHATSTPAQIATSRTNGVAYLKTLQAADGSFASSGLSNEWAFSAFAAAGTAAVDIAPGDDVTKNARTVYRNQLSAPSWPGASPVVTDYERAALNAYAAGIDPARVSSGQNLIAKIASYWQPSAPGYYGPPANFNGTVFALLALAGGKTQAGAPRVPQSLLNASVTVVRANQHTDGGWNFSQAAGNPAQLAAPSDIDMTGATMAALCASGVANTDSAVQAGKNFLKSKLINASGAFNSMFGANTNSNGWAVSGLNACGIPSQGIDFTTPAGRTPIDFLRAQQFTPGGGFRYLPSDTAPQPYASIDAVRAISGGGFTATPPVPVTAGAPQWVGTTTFTSGQTSTLALVIDTGTGSPNVCSVSVTPTGSTTTLGAVLDAATTAATPTGCVTSRAPTSGTGTVTSINGVTNSGASTWKLSVDAGAAAAATRGATISLGDTISLRYGS
ncbi:prenyltransferase/squalene oxidase repeat-containing protein [Micromonospora sp. NPDC050397]|uniref:prenyltransferase/squalene oxidase repeat-containing protein n=1 Tax=Micromonospora sp. NPDC050397 TaxID=3364279 RepID=UPI00384D9D95